MKRVVEFDLVTRSEPNQRFASHAGMFAKAARTKAQREAVRAVLRSSLGSPPPLHVVQVGERFEAVGAVGMAVRNTIAVTLTRIAPGLLDAFENLPAALKAIVDEVAAWCGPKDNDPIYTWKAEQRKSEAGVYRIELVIVDKLTGADRIVRLAETRSVGVQTAARVKRAVKKAKLAPAGTEDASPRMLVPCKVHGAAIGEVCSPLFFMSTGNICPARARLAGLVTAAERVVPRLPPGPRKFVPAARPAGQTVLPMLRAFALLPWENECDVCVGTGLPAGTDCEKCGGSGHAKSRVLTRAARYDGLDEPPTTITASVPAEHVSRYGSTVTLTRQKFDSRATGPCWLYATDERTKTT